MPYDMSNANRENIQTFKINIFITNFQLGRSLIL